MRNGLRLAGFGLGLFLTLPLSAHHGFFAEYDGKRKLKMDGVVNKVLWANPHIRVDIDVKGPDGKVITWNLEVTSPSALERKGWTKTTLLAGDRVAFEAYRSKIVGNRGLLASITKWGEGRPLFILGAPEVAPGHEAGP